MKTFKQFNEESIAHHDKLSEEIGNPLELLPLAAVKYGPKIVKGAKAVAKLGHRVLGRPLARRNLKTGVKFGAPVKQGGAMPGMGLVRMGMRPLNRAFQVGIGNEVLQGTRKALKSDKKPLEKTKDVAGELVKGAYLVPGGFKGIAAATLGPSIIKDPKGSLEFAKNVGRGAKRLGTDIGKAFINKVKQVRANNKAVPKSLPKVIQKVK